MWCIYIYVVKIAIHKIRINFKKKAMRQSDITHSFSAYDLKKQRTGVRSTALSEGLPVKEDSLVLSSAPPVTPLLSLRVFWPVSGRRSVVSIGAFGFSRIADEEHG